MTTFSDSFISSQSAGDLFLSQMVPARRWAERKLIASLPSGHETGSTLLPEAAGEYLLAIRASLTAVAAQHCQTMSSSTWLWYLRRVDPAVVRGRLPNTESSIFRIAENLSGGSGKDPSSDVALTTQPLLTYAFTALPLSKIARLLSISELINGVESWLRRAGKGARFVVQSKDLPELIFDEALEASIELHDVRVVDDVRSKWHPLLEDLDVSNRDTYPLIGALRVSGGWQEVPTWEGRMTGTQKIALALGQFVVNVLQLPSTDVSVALRGAIAATPRPAYAFALIAMAQGLAFHAAFRSEVFGLVIPRFGYATLENEYVGALLDEVLQAFRDKPWPLLEGVEIASSDDVIRILESASHSGARSAHGPVVRRSRVGIIVDVHALLNELQSALRFDSSSGGELMNLPAFAFEAETQMKIDSTTYTPPAAIRAMRGRTLRLKGKNVTDLDAIFTAGSTLYVVSCKKVEFTVAYDSGDYRKVRSAESTITAAITRWANVVQTLTMDRAGDNYDFSQFESIQGIVLTPSVMFVRDPAALRRLEGPVEGLSAYMSLGELTHVLTSVREGIQGTHNAP